jgi:hypothetical protein
MTVTVTPVEEKKGQEAFLRFPWKIYVSNGKRDPFWVPPFLPDQRSLLNPKKNPFFKHGRAKLFMALDGNGEIVGRISASVDDNFNQFQNEKCGFFGFFECINDVDAARSLFSQAEKYLKDEGMTVARGPSSFTSNDDYYGFLVNGVQQPPVIAMPYNPTYYLELAEKCGYKKAMDLYAWWQGTDKPFAPRVMRIAEAIKKREGITIRSLNMKDYDNEIRKFKEVYNKAWQKNWGFVPMTDEEFLYQARKLKDVIWPDFVTFAEVNGKTVAASLSSPDINQVLIKMDGELFSWSDPFAVVKFLWYMKKVKSVRLMALGVVEECRNRGIDAVLYAEAYKNAVNRKLIGGELSWTLETNTMVNSGIEKAGASIYKTYRIYEKKLI